MAQSAKFRVLPGFGLSLGYTLVYLSLIVLIPLSAVFIKAASMDFADFWQTISDPAVVSSYRVSFLTSLLAAAINISDDEAMDKYSGKLFVVGIILFIILMCVIGNNDDGFN